MAKTAPKRKAANGYKLAERLPAGEILEDINKKKWILGTPIGRGGFGEIYAAKDANSTSSNFPLVIKIEPHTNGPLFVEMHFYMRNAKPTDVEVFKKEKGFDTFGMPSYFGSGSHEYKNEKYRFIVMENLGTSIWKMFLDNNKTLPTDTVFKIGIQIIDVLEYIHKRGYVHADIKGTNILMGASKATRNQVYLIDFGLATKYFTGKQFKPDPKKAHDGTIEYLSRDAHQGVQTRRGDLEILAYNLIQWLCGTLPWEKNLKDPNSVQKSKEECMDNVPKMIKTCFGHRTPPGAIVDFLNYLKTLDFNSEPDYNRIRKIFISGVKDAGGSEKSPLNFSISKNTPDKRKNDRSASLSPKRKVAKPTKQSAKTQKENLESDENDEEVSIQNDLQLKPKKKGAKRNKKTANSNEVEEKVTEAENKDTSKKTKRSKKDTEEGQSETADPYEGYTEAMKEVVNKLQKAKSSKQKNKPVEENGTEGYNESMKEMALKKNGRLASKKAVSSKTSVQDEPSGVTRSYKLRAHKDICYSEFDSN